MSFCSDLTRMDTALAFVVATVLYTLAHARLDRGLMFAATFVVVFLAMKNILL